MKPIEYDSVKGLEAFQYMRPLLVQNPSRAALSAITKAALLQEYPAQDVLAAAAFLYRSNILSSSELSHLVDIQLPQDIVTQFLSAGREYVPAPTDTAHIVITEQMSRAIEASARSCHENWRSRREAQGLTIDDNPMLRPWEDLSIEERSSTVSSVTEVAKAIAAGGGITAAELDFPETQARLALSLDEHVHDVWAKNNISAGARYGIERTRNNEGRDVTHPDLLPFKDLSADAKSYDHAITMTVLDTLRREGIDIGPQLTEERLKTPYESRCTDPEIDQSAPRQELSQDRYDELPERLVRDALANIFIQRDIAERGPKDLLRNEFPARAVQEMAPFTQDVLLKDRYILEKGAVPRLTSDGHVEVSVTALDGSAGKLSSKDVPQVLWALHDEAEKQGFSILSELDTIRSKVPVAIGNLVSASARQKYLNRAGDMMAAFEKEGFRFVANTVSARGPGMRIPGDDVRFFAAAEEACHNLTDLFSALRRVGSAIGVAYEGSDTKICEAGFLDDVERLRKTPQPAYLANRILSGVYSHDDRLAAVKNAVDGFKERLRDPYSFDSAVWAVMGNDKDALSELRIQAKMLCTGSSYNQAKEGYPLPGLKNDLSAAVSDIERYLKANSDYHRKSAIGRLFSARPVFPAAQVEMVRRCADRLSADMATETALAEAMTFTVTDKGGVIKKTVSPIAGDFTARYGDLISSVRRVASSGVTGSENIDFLYSYDESLRKMSDLSRSGHGDAVPSRESVVRALSPYGIGVDAADAVYEKLSRGEHAMLEGEINVRPARSYDPHPQTRSVCVAVGLDGRGSLMLYHPVTGQEIGPLKTMLAGDGNLLFKGSNKPDTSPQKQTKAVDDSVKGKKI